MKSWYTYFIYRTLFIYIINFQTPESQLGSSKSSLNTTFFFQLVDVTSLYFNRSGHCKTSLLLTCSEVWRDTAFCTVLSYMWISCSEVFPCKDFCKKTKFYWESQPSYKIFINSQFSNVSFSWAWRCTWQFLLSFVFPLTPVCKFSRLSGCGS